jgi:hypothetical protein
MSSETQQTLNPWLAIWTRPRATIRQRVERDPEAWVLALFAVAGVGHLLSDASARSLGDRVDLPTLLVMALLIGPLFGILGAYVGGWLLRWSGRLLGGAARPVEIRAAIAWSGVPYVASMLLWIPELLLFGDELFTEATPRLDTAPELQGLLLAFVAVELTAALWAFVAFLKCLGEVQGFSAWRALLNLLLPGVLVGIAVGLVVALFFVVAD